MSRFIKNSWIVFVFIPLLIFGQDKGFMVKFKNEVTPFTPMALFVSPGEEVSLEAVFIQDKDTFQIQSERGLVTRIEDGKWLWKAPYDKGIYTVKIIAINRLDTITFNCMVMVPMEQMVNGKINGYRIGEYPSSSNKHYPVPKGFIEVTKENENTLVSPNYRLKDFLCKQAGDYPKYVILRERGIIKLETVQAYLQDRGFDFDRFSFISGYRTPHYNTSIGNVKYSRHVFGDAYDIYIDRDNDYRMDDLNGDGVYNKKDAQYLFEIIDKLHDQPWYSPFIGGLGLYGANSRHPAFLHMDSRGFRARWGN